MYRHGSSELELANTTKIVAWTVHRKQWDLRNLVKLLFKQKK